MLLQNNKSNGIYSIVDQNNILFPVYYDFGSEPGMAWTLFQSHSLQNKVACRKSFYLHDLPVNQDAPEWNRYSLSMSRMKSIQNFSTPWRATCNFPTDGVGYQDYWGVSLTNLDLLVKPPTNESCLFSDFINVLGNYCSNCMGLTAYSDIFALHTDSPFSYSKGCEFNGTLGAVYDEDNFGVDGESNSAFRCTSSSASTTQFWFGKHD